MDQCIIKSVMKQGQLSAVIQLGHYATVALSWSGGKPYARGPSSTCLRRGAACHVVERDEWRWERSQEGDALVSVALNDVAAVTRTALRTPQPTAVVALAFISIAPVHLPL